MEQYKVKLWVTDKVTGFRKQITEDVDLKTESKSAHKRAERLVLNKYKHLRPEIISVICC